MFFVISDVLKSLFFVMDFKDPATLYMQSLINVHNSVMWYLVIIIAIVYWILYKIVKDSNWTTFNKQVGFLRTVYTNSIFLALNSLICYLYVLSGPFFFQASLFFTNFFYNFFPQKKLKFSNGSLRISDKVYVEYTIGPEVRAKYSKKDFGFYIMIPLVSLTNFSLKKPVYWFAGDKHISLLEIRELLTLKYLDTLLFNSTNWGYLSFGWRSRTYFVSRYSPFLLVQKFKHSTMLEIVWATFPSVIILLILVPSILLIYSIDERVEPEFTIRVIGHQWFWSYEFDEWLNYVEWNNYVCPINIDPSTLNKNLLGHFSFEFDSCMVITDSLNIGDKRLLEVDNPLVVPVNIGFRLLITSADVLHSWAVPELGIKVDAVPGRLSQIVTMIRRPGFFYGQCSEICGVAHAFMPIVIKSLEYNIESYNPLLCNSNLTYTFSENSKYKNLI